jgi:hypothetical protein
MTVPGRRRLLRALLSSGAAVALVGGGCARELTLGSDQPGTAATAGSAGSAGAPVAGTSGAGGTAGTGTANVGGAGGEAPCVPSLCRGKVYECGNCRDDDDDGRIDAEDRECTGPCDNLENSLSVGLPGESSGACNMDCYFDSGNGAGSEDCNFSQHCDELTVAPDYPPSGESSCLYDENTKIPGTNGTCADLRAEQPAGCAATCGPLTPNGCDCFGCCELPAGSGSYIWLETSLPCSPVEACLNRCEPCELCVGRPEPLPSCASAEEACTTGYRSCGGTEELRCQAGAYCVTGCCIPEPR